jgi:hypothetical protein
MPEKKNQHFVPRVYLKHFSPVDSGKTIGLFNLNTSTTVEQAPTKSQCSRPYFHGNDELEDILADVEGRYGDWVGRGVLADPPLLVDDLDRFLHFFFALQYVRTEHAQIRTRAMFEAQKRMMGFTPEDEERFPFPEGVELVRQSVGMSLEFRRHISDLKLALIRNRSDVPFVTSDDPVCFTNRLHLQRLRRRSFGWGSAGTLFYCPFSPTIAACLYDSDVYLADKKDRHWIELTKKADARALNELMFLKARENIYFRNAADFDRDHFELVRHRRVDQYTRGTILKKVGEDEDGEVYRATDEEVMPQLEGARVMTQSVVHAEPTSWFSLIRFRSQPVAYTNGSAAGYVRKHTAQLDGMAVEKVRV